MSEKVYGIISVLRVSWFGFSLIFEALCFTTDCVIVARTERTYGRSGGLVTYRAAKKAEGLTGLSAEELLKTDINNFVLLYSDIKKVELKKYLRGARINITTNEKKYRWFVQGIPGQKSPKIEDYERILRSAIPDKSSVSK
jgi:hypothetical protein